MLPEAHVEYGPCSSISYATEVRSEHYIYPSDLSENQSQDRSSDVTLINCNLEMIRNSTARLSGMNTTFFLETMRGNKRCSSPEMTSLLSSTNQTVVTTNQLLISLKIAAVRMKSDGISRTQEVIVFEGIMDSLETQYLECSQNYKAMQQKYKSDIEKKIMDEVLIRRPAATNNEVFSALNGADTLNSTEDGSVHALPVANICHPVSVITTANIVESVMLNYPDLETLNKSLFDLNQSCDGYCVLAQSVDARPMEAIGTRPLLSQNDQGELVDEVRLYYVRRQQVSAILITIGGTIFLLVYFGVLRMK